FTCVAGVPATNIARWNGTTWSVVGGGTDFPVESIGVADDGTGPALFASGSFTRAGGLGAGRVARWNGSWSVFGQGLDASVSALVEHDDGSGRALFAGGMFRFAGGVATNYIARWNGSAWTGLSSLQYEPTRAMDVHDDGAGPKLYAGGQFPLPSG